MADRSSVVAATLLSLVAVGAVVAAGVWGSPAVLAQAGNETADEESSYGAQVSAFAQVTAADANASVDRGLWIASVNETDKPGQAVENRTSVLDRRLERLRNRSAALEAARENGSISGVAYTARASSVRARLANLREDVNETSQVARRTGVDESRLAALRSATGNATGPEIAAIARTITDAGPSQRGPPGDRERGSDGRRGPPDNGTAGPPDNRTAGPSENGTSGPTGDRTGPPSNGTGPFDGSDRDSDSAGNGSSSSGAGSGNGTPDGDGSTDAEGGRGDGSGNGSDGADGRDRSGDGPLRRFVELVR